MSTAHGFSVAVVGATGMVGKTMLRILAERHFPIASLKLLASERSVGKSLSFKGKTYPVEKLKNDSFKGVQVALFSAGASRGLEFASHAVRAGAVVIDNSSAFRYDASVPLIVPEVNLGEIKKHQGIIANPNCSTIQLVAVLNPIYQAVGLKRVVVSTYQSVSGAGAQAVKKLLDDTKRLSSELAESGRVTDLLEEKARTEPRPATVAFNCVPHIDVFEENGYTREEMKMVRETRKILNEPDLAITTTAVRVPVFRGHSESVNIETEKPLSVEDARALLAQAPGVKVIDTPEDSQYPLALECMHQDAVFVGRIRKDETLAQGLNLWVVSDNLRKGAALNAIQIAEEVAKTL